MRIGIDLGGTKTEIVVLDEQGDALYRHREPTPAEDYNAILGTIARLVALAEEGAGHAQSVGIATPGAISGRTGLMKNSNTVVLNGRPLDRDIALRLQRPVRLENDANCLALSEAIDGAASGASTVFGVILGTGVGGGIVIDKALLVGHNRVAGEWGHNPLPWPRAEDLPGAACYCGKVGCIETYLSGRGLSRDFYDRSGTQCTALEISGAAQRGDSRARECIQLYRDRLARSLATVVNVMDPEAIVLAGGLSNMVALCEGLPEMIASYAFSDGLDTRIVRAAHGDSSGVRGAARLWG
jgi:fructokinase